MRIRLTCVLTVDSSITRAADLAVREAAGDERERLAHLP